MNRKILSKNVKERRAISPIIATLLLILIAIAAGVVVYVYVIGFVGNSTTNTGNAQSTIQISNACISITTTHCNTGAYYIIIQNVGSTTLANGGVAQIYFQDITSGATSTISCTLTSALSPGGQLIIPSGCSATTGSLVTVSAGDQVTFKVVAADGGSATYSTKVIS